MENKLVPGKMLLHITMLSSLVILSGCSTVGDKEESKTEATMPATTGDGVVLMSMDGKPVITSDGIDEEFEVFFERVLEQNAQLKAMLQFMPNLKDELFENFFRGLVNQHIIDRYITDKGFSNSQEYKKELEMLMMQLKHSLNAKYFVKELGEVSVSDAETRRFYEEHKNEPQFMVAQGGIKAIAVPFDSEAAAKAFMEKVSAKASEIKQIAEQDGLGAKVRELLVNNQGFGVDPKLRDAILAETKFPAVKVFNTDDKNHWVVYMSGKEEAKYREFDEIKEALKGELAQEKQKDLVNAELDKLRAKYKVDVNEKYFEKQQPAENDEVSFADDEDCDCDCECGCELERKAA